jgi:hypothetical protein
MLAEVEDALTLALVRVDLVEVVQVDRIVLVFLQLMELSQLVVEEEELEIIQHQNYTKVLMVVPVS